MAATEDTKHLDMQECKEFEGTLLWIALQGRTSNMEFWKLHWKNVRHKIQNLKVLLVHATKAYKGSGWKYGSTNS